eukprot:CAMPEP_0119130906 /NCGR_PEP_ID=MMETSP1310-20130426/9028_1 /TAXON_ID=464262 /ORGANISM="Genus nov. species nov., Strain RCC2339" /LENGTH=857 /DNA_ID=CAMNT_0007121447 /DNA_START=56 /DNA_END=2629 /DNA_ORIENTATION=+
MAGGAKDNTVIRLKPHTYIHVQDLNSLTTELIIGPSVYTRQSHQTVVTGPEAFISIPPRHCIRILNPVVRDAEGTPVTDQFGNFKLRHGQQEIRFAQEKEPLPGVSKEAIYNAPFPLYPGEQVSKKSPLLVVKADEALRLRASADVELDGVKRVTGQEWLFKGPGTYIPHVDVQEVESVKAYTIGENKALCLRAKRDCVDSQGQKRTAGEEWLVRKVGSYLPNVEEEVKDLVSAHVLTDIKAIHLRAVRAFQDVYGTKRATGEEWLVTNSLAETHIPDVSEEFVGEVSLTSLNNRQYCVVQDPIDESGANRLGARELRKGECSFFLNPGERLLGGVQNVHVLGEDEALLLCATETFKDGEVERLPGDRWQVHGPCDYIPPIHVNIVERQRTIPLDENEGIYVRDNRSGRVRTVMGESYLLKPSEELWEKELPAETESLLESTSRDAPGRSKQRSSRAARDKTRVVSYRAPHNSAVQIYDYKARKARFVFGPDLALLGADEEFTVLRLSGGTPKRESAISSLCLFLGPDFMTDTMTVETCDHARLMLKLAYNWHFDVDGLEDHAKGDRIFAVSDFVGDACKAIASRVRGAVAASSFDAFHRGSSDIIRKAVFGVNKETGAVRDALRFAANGLVVSNIDVQSVEPIDQRTRDALQRSVQLAIEITTKSQEATARHQSMRDAQIARGKLQIQMIEDEVKAEKEKQKLLYLRAHAENIQAAGEATADARARADAADIQAQAAVEKARHAADAKRIKANAEIARVEKKNQNELNEVRALNELEINRARRMAAIETKKFKETVDAIGPDTIQAIAQAGPELQAKLLQGLGLKSFLITDGNSPINLLGTASGLVGQAGPSAGEL